MGKLASIGGAIAGGLIGGPTGAMIGGQLGGMLGGSSGGGGGYSNVSGAYDTASAAQLQAARNAQFRPVGISTRFGSSQFGIDPSTGQLTSAGYSLSPEAKALQDYALAGAYSGTGDTSNLLSLGRSYLAGSPADVASQYIAEQRQLLAPSTESQLSNIRSNLQRTGRGGLAVGQGGSLAASNPELQAYYNSLAQRDLQLASEAEQEARNRITFGQGLLSTAYTPITSGLDIASKLESLGQTSLAMGSELGGRAAQAGANAGRLFSDSAQTALAGQIAQQGLNATRQTSQQNQLSGLLNNPAVGGLLGNAGNQIGNWFNNLISPTPYSDRGTMYSNDPGSYTGFDY